MSRILKGLLIISFLSGIGAEYPYSAGDKWRVTAIYRSPADGGRSWSPPIVWEYTVAGIERNSSGRSVAEIMIRDPEGLRSETATLKIDLARMSLLEVKCDYLVQGRPKHLIQEYDVVGSSILRFPITTAPFVVPGIPVDALHFHREGLREFRTRKATLEDYQKASAVVGPAMKNEQMRAGRGFDNFDDLFVVEVSESGRPTLFQIWKKNRPWPIFAEAFGCRSFTDAAFTTTER